MDDDVKRIRQGGTKEGEGWIKEERQEAMIGFLPRLIQKGDHEICIVAHQAALRCSIPGQRSRLRPPARPDGGSQFTKVAIGGNRADVRHA